MALDRVHSSETQLFYTGVRVPAVQSISFSTDKSSTDLRPLGDLSYKERILNSNQTTNFSYSILVTTGASGFDPFYTFQEQEIGFLSTRNYGFNIRDFAGQNTITGAYLTSYSLEGSVGGFVRGTSSYEADDVSYTASNSIDFTDLSSDNFNVFIPRNIEITSSSLSSEGSSTSTLNIQNFNINVGITRRPVNILGSRTPEFRYPELPIDGSFDISFLKNSVTGIDLSSLVVDTGTMSVNLKNDAGTTMMSYTMNQSSLKSVSESIDLDGNNSINFSYTFCVKK
jgi:hypothetical protein